MAYIFLSYAKPDRDAALMIRDLLQYEGLTVWMDENESELKAKYAEMIQENIRNAGAFIFLISDAAKKSSAELKFAEEIKKPIFPILIQGEAWSRLSAETVVLGREPSLNLPSEFWLRLREQMHDAPNKPLPLQVLQYTEKVPTKNQSVYLWLGLGVTLFVLAVLIPLGMEWFENNEREVARAETSVARETRIVEVQSTSDAAMLTREALHEAGTETRAYRDEVRATETAVSQATRQAVLTQESRERIILTATQLALLAAPTQTAQYELNQTAIAANAFVPCDAIAPRVNGEINLQIYRLPTINNNYSLRNPSGTEDYPVIVVRWIANESGMWLEVGTERLASIGYVRPEAVILDANCSE